MYLTDFVFDGVKLSTLGFLVGAAVTSNSDSSSAGSRLNLTTVLNRGNYINQIVTTEYSEPITVTFDIIKYACNDAAKNEISDLELSSLMRWLNRTEYCKFKPKYNDNFSFYQVYYMGTFTEINTINMGGIIVGLTVTFVASTPYGYAEYDSNEFTVSSANGSFVYYDMSDELGEHYPEKMTIMITQAGDFTIKNEVNSRITRINNCVANEIITLDCINKIITSSLVHPLVPTLSDNTGSNGEVIHYATQGSPATNNAIWKAFDGSTSTWGGYSGNDVN